MSTAYLKLAEKEFFLMSARTGRRGGCWPVCWRLRCRDPREPPAASWLLLRSVTEVVSRRPPQLPCSGLDAVRLLRPSGGVWTGAVGEVCDAAGHPALPSLSQTEGPGHLLSFCCSGGSRCQCPAVPLGGFSLLPTWTWVPPGLQSSLQSGIITIIRK